MNFKITILKDILKQAGKDGKLKYSQARVYTFISVMAYFLVHGVMTWKAYHPNDSAIDIEVLKLIKSGLFDAMVLFCSYTFGGKFLEVVQALKGNDKKEEKPAE